VRGYIAGMAFTWVHKKRVASDQGFSVQMTGLHSWEYAENDQRMSLEGEFLHPKDEVGSKFTYAFYPSWRNARWEPPHHYDDITASDRLRIRTNMIEGIAFMGGKAIFD